MAPISARGIILKKYFLRETSYILVIYTRDFGKIRGVLKGARNPYPQFAGNFEIFTLCDITFYKKKKMDLITACESADFFLPIRKDIERLTYADYFIELVDVITADYDANAEIYDALYESLKMISLNASARRVSRIFEMNILKSIGLKPIIDYCAKCETRDTGNMSFNPKMGGVLCASCAKEESGSMRISLGTVNFMRKIYETPILRTGMIKVSAIVGREIENVLRSFINYHVARDLKSMKFLSDITKKGVLKESYA